MNKSKLAEYVERLNQNRPYHWIDFGDGVIVRGQVNLARHLDALAIPTDLRGCRVLDVGTATGFLALECARRGAAVTAIDVFADSPVAELARLSGADVRFICRDLYDLDPSFGTFDLVVCGSLLMHLSDPIGATRALRAVCEYRLILSTACTCTTNPMPLFELVGARAAEGYWSFWAANAAGVVRLCKVAGFASVNHVAHFTLEWEPPYKAPPVDHVVVSAMV